MKALVSHKRNLLRSITAIAASTSAFVIAHTGEVDAKVLRSKDSAAAILIFKGADELRRFDKIANKPGGADTIESLLACRVPQGTSIVVLGSGHRTAFVKVIDGPASGCQGTVPKVRVQEQ
jgi:hypothetical protein